MTDANTPEPVEPVDKELERKKDQAEDLLESILGDLSPEEVFGFMRRIRRARTIGQVNAIISELEQIRRERAPDELGM